MDDATATCQFLQKQYGITPNQTWGRLKDLDLRAFWDKNGCNARLVQPAASSLRLPVHAYWGNWNSLPNSKSLALLKQVGKGATFISSFWDVTKDCQVSGRNTQQEVVLRGIGCTVLAGIGGWGSTTPWASLTRDKPVQLAAAIATAVNDAGWNGIALDWEYPNGQGEWTALTDFCKAYKQAAPQHVLAIAASSDISPDCDWIALGKIVDWIHVMTYDFSGEWSSLAVHNSSVSQGIAALKGYEAAGAPRAKLMFGSAWYGRQCKAATLGTQAVGPWTELTFADISKLTASSTNWAKYRSADGSPWMTLRDGSLLTYEDPACVQAKLDWVRNNGFGGVFCWELGQDNSTGDLEKALLQI